MNPRAGTFAREGMLFGLSAGTLLTASQMVTSAVMGVTPLRPLQQYAALGAGEVALRSTSLMVLSGGIITLATLAPLYGYAYVLIVARGRGPTRSYAWEAGLGALYGLAAWFVSYQLIARAAFPWMLEIPWPVQAALHALFFGVPMGLMLAAGERHERAQPDALINPV